MGKYNNSGRPSPRRYVAACVAVMAILFLGCSNRAAADTAAARLPRCAELAGSLQEGAPLKAARSGVVRANGQNVGHCRVDLRYGTSPEQNINIVILLPLSAADKGGGGVQGAWNGRTQGQGGGGCTGNIFQAPLQVAQANEALRQGYVVSGNDLGHAGGDCEPGVNNDGTYNRGFIDDFIRTGIKQQVLWSKAVAKRYYGVAATYNYWNGCSTGGRQGYVLAQELGDELEGIMANAPAIYWTRFQTAQMWGQIAMRDLTGGAIAPDKLEQTRVSAVAACDAADGVSDGIIDDPRACTFSAKANICGAPGAPTRSCLTAAEAQAIDRIWDGPRNAQHDKIWFGLDRGSDFGILDGIQPFPLGSMQFHWDEHARTFDWKTVTLNDYARIAQDGSRNIAAVTDSDGPLDAFKAHGGKLLTFVGLNDQFIYPRGVIHYYRQMASRYADGGKPDFARLQGFYRLFAVPGVGHCGGGPGPVPVDSFGTLVKWVEHGVAPDSMLASGGTAAPPTGRTRPLCPYPQRALYNGSGSTDDAKSFHCGGNVESVPVVCADVLTGFKQEVSGGLDFSGMGVSRRECAAH